MRTNPQPEVDCENYNTKNVRSIDIAKKVWDEGAYFVECKLIREQADDPPPSF